MTWIRIATLALASTALLGGATRVEAQAVSLEFHDGRVSLSAENASLRAILAEWARLGGTQVVNADRLAGAPVTLQLTDVPEMQALDVILRGTAGYIAGLRPLNGPAGTQSSLDRILVVPTAGTAAVVARPATAPPPFVQQRPQPFPQDPDDDPVSDVPPDDDLPPRGGLRNGAPVNIQRNGPVQAPPQPFDPQDDEPPPNAPAPTNPFGIQTGSSRPGTISPVPQPTNRPPAPQPSEEP